MLTERTGGSDLAALETTAVPDGDAWRLSGLKWFASNANGSAFVVLAKPEGAPDGIRGIAPFLVLRERRDGGRNGVRIRRLKDKLGTKAVASAEVEFARRRGVPAGAGRPIAGAGGGVAAGDGRGLARMMELTNGARLGIAMMGLGCARRALVESLCYAHAREAFGAELSHHPLMQRKLAELIVEVEAAQALVFDGYLGPAAAHRRAADQAARRPARHHRRQRRHRDPRRQRLHRAVARRPAAARRPGEHGLGGPRQHPVPRRPPRHGARRRRRSRSSTGCARPPAGRRATTRPPPPLVAGPHRRPGAGHRPLAHARRPHRRGAPVPAGAVHDRRLRRRPAPRAGRLRAVRAGHRPQAAGRPALRARPPRRSGAPPGHRRAAGGAAALQGPLRRRLRRRVMPRMAPRASRPTGRSRTSPTPAWSSRSGRRAACPFMP